jgi:EmrB/QacA subfamily drug resistance transporter
MIVGFAYFMYGLDSTIVATAVPGMARSFEVNPIRLGIAIVAYVVSMAVFVPISGWLADRFGASVTFASAIAIFTLGSLACGLSHNIIELASARVLQGIGGALILPVGRLVILRNVPKTQFIKALAMLGLFPTMGSMLGPPVGGFITTYASWQWIFLINVPIGVAGLILVPLYIENFRGAERRPLDWAGFLLSGISLSAIVYGFEALGRGSSDAGAMSALMVFGIAVGYFAVRHARRDPNSLLDLSLLRIATLRKNVTGGSLFRITTGGIPFLLPLLFQVGFGMTAFRSGMLTVSIAVGVLSVRLLIVHLLKRLGFRVGLVINGILCTLGPLLCCLLTPTTPPLPILALLYFIGFAQGFQFTTLNTLAYADVPPARMSAAASFCQLFQQLSQGMGVAIAASLLHIGLLVHGTDVLSRSDFVIAFLGLALFDLASIWSFWKLKPESGEEITGHNLPKAS